MTLLPKDITSLTLYQCWGGGCYAEGSWRLPTIEGSTNQSVRDTLLLLSCCFAVVFTRHYRHTSRWCNSEDSGGIQSQPQCFTPGYSFNWELCKVAEKLSIAVQCETLQDYCVNIWKCFEKRLSTPADSLVLSILKPNVFTLVAVEWGVQQEAASSSTSHFSRVMATQT